MTRRLLMILLLLVAFHQTFAIVWTPEKRKLVSKKPLIEKIVIVGNLSFPEKEIKKHLYTKEDGFWQSVGLMGRNRLGKINAVYDKTLLEYYYRNKGFYDARVEVDFDGDKERTHATLHINIAEGPRYRVDTVAVEGLIGHDEERVTSIVGRMKHNDYLNSSDLELSKQEIKTHFANTGYPYATDSVDIYRDLRDSTVDLTFRISPETLVVFGDVIIDTTILTNRKVFQKEITFKKGDVYSRDKFFESQQRLIRTGLFSYISLKPTDTTTNSNNPMPDFRVTAIERPPKYVNLAVGASQTKVKDFLWDLTGAVGNRNIAGTARRMRFESTTSFQAFSHTWGFAKQQFLYSFIEPYLFWIRMPLTLTFTYEPGVKDLVQDYRIQTGTVEATLVREFSLESKLTFSGLYEQFKIFAADTTKIEEYKKEQGISISRKLTAQYERDTRPLLNKFNPDIGSYTTYNAEFAGGFLGGDNSYFKLIYSWSKYNKFLNNGVFASRIKFGWVKGFGDSANVPTKDRFYLGGAYTVRGFSENRLGPSDTSDVTIPAGGESIGILNLELRKPLFWQLWTTTFVDFGYNVAHIRDLSWRSPALTFGLGVVWMSPVGPVRVEYGQRTTLNNYPGGGTVHFSILYAF